MYVLYMYAYTDMHIINMKALAEVSVNITRLFRFFKYLMFSSRFITFHSNDASDFEI